MEKLIERRRVGSVVKVMQAGAIYCAIFAKSIKDLDLVEYF
jgi:hypothetical protein